jgi:hypothetical protein
MSPNAWRVPDAPPDIPGFLCPSGHRIPRKYVKLVWEGRTVQRCPCVGCRTFFFVTATGISEDGSRQYVIHAVTQKQLARLGERPSVEQILTVLGLE